MEIIKVVPLPIEDSGLQRSIVRLNNRHIDAKRQDRKRFFRRDALVIENAVTGEKILRYAMGSAGQEGISLTAIALDYDAANALSIRFKEEVRLDVRRATRWEVYRWFWDHPDLSVQLSIRLGMTGAFLGLLGLTTGLIGLVPMMFG